jgi:hypothetical protein
MQALVTVRKESKERKGDYTLVSVNRSYKIGLENNILYLSLNSTNSCNCVEQKTPSFHIHQQHEQKKLFYIFMPSLPGISQKQK